MGLPGCVGLGPGDGTPDGSGVALEVAGALGDAAGLGGAGTGAGEPGVADGGGVGGAGTAWAVARVALATASETIALIATALRSIIPLRTRPASPVTHGERAAR